MSNYPTTNFWSTGAEPSDLLNCSEETKPTIQFATPMVHRQVMFWREHVWSSRRVSNMMTRRVTRTNLTQCDVSAKKNGDSLNVILGIGFVLVSLALLLFLCYVCIKSLRKHRGSKSAWKETRRQRRHLNTSAHGCFNFKQTFESGVCNDATLNTVSSFFKFLIQILLSGRWTPMPVPLSCQRRRVHDSSSFSMNPKTDAALINCMLEKS